MNEAPKIASVEFETCFSPPRELLWMMLWFSECSRGNSSSALSVIKMMLGQNSFPMQSNYVVSNSCVFLHFDDD